MSEGNFVVWATSSPTGLSIIGRRYEGSAYICDLYTMKMTMNPETGERYFSFAPLNALTKSQVMPWESFKQLANRSVHCGYYNPATSVSIAYLEFVDSKDRVDHMASYYLEEKGPAQEYLDKLEHEKIGKVEFVKNKKSKCEGKVIKGAFACVEEE